jgi:hypothetical protein
LSFYQICWFFVTFANNYLFSADNKVCTFQHFFWK